MPEPNKNRCKLTNTQPKLPDIRPGSF